MPLEIHLHTFVDKKSKRNPLSSDLLTGFGGAIRDRFQSQVILGKRLQVPEYAYHQAREQYRADAFIERLAELPSRPGRIHLGITDVDLFSSRLNFVFGEASPLHRVAVFSLSRLNDRVKLDHHTFVRRASTEAIHELGHALSLNHCEHADCVMWFSNTLRETDRKGTHFCPHHQAILDQELALYRPKAA